MVLHELIWETYYSESNGVPTVFQHDTIIVGSVSPSCTPRRYQFAKLSLPSVSLSLWRTVVFLWMHYACPRCVFSYCLLWSMLIQLYHILFLCPNVHETFCGCYMLCVCVCVCVWERGNGCNDYTATHV